jgi:hypothetical protein
MSVETLRAAYDLLNAQRPFNLWNLPDGEDVTFRVVRDRKTMGWASGTTIAISRSCVGHLDTLLRVMAHEMVHLHQHRNKLEISGVEHNTAFRRDIARVAKALGFDPRAI